MFAKIRTFSVNRRETTTTFQCDRITVMGESTEGLGIIINGDLTLEYNTLNDPHFDLWIMNDAGKTIDHRGWRADFPPK